MSLKKQLSHIALQMLNGVLGIRRCNMWNPTHKEYTERERGARMSNAFSKCPFVGPHGPRVTQYCPWKWAEYSYPFLKSPYSTCVW